MQQVLTKLNFQAVLSISGSVLCSFPGELCAFHTHYEMGRNAFLKNPTTLLLKLFDFCLFLAEISVLRSLLLLLE